MTEPDDRIRQLLTESVDAELGARLDVPSARVDRTDRAPAAPPRRIASWAMPIAAAAAVVGVVIGVVAVERGPGSTHTPAGSGTAVTCAATGPGDVARDRSTLLARARSLGDGTPSVRADGRSVVVRVPGAGAKAVTSLCSSTTLALRPVIAPGVVAAQHGTLRRPLAHLGFAAPDSEAAYDRLTAAQRATLAERLRHAACGPSRFGAAAPVVACSAGINGARLAYLLGNTVLDGSAVKAASALAPTIGTAGSSWSVALTFDRTGGKAWSEFTGRHHVDGSQAADASITACSAGRVPCEDFVAFVTDGRVLAAPLTTARLSTQTQITGTYTRKEAHRLAKQLGAGRLPVPLHVVGSRTFH